MTKINLADALAHGHRGHRETYWKSLRGPVLRFLAICVLHDRSECLLRGRIAMQSL